jgi:tetratricopeptide (TPR) repeat protein
VDEKLTSRAKLIYERDSNSPLFLRTAYYYFQISDPQTALSILEKGLKIFPDHPLAFILMGKVHIKLGELELAKFFFKKSSELLNSNQTFIYYKNEFKLTDKQTSPFDSSRGSIFINSTSEDLLKELLLPAKTDSIEDRLSQIAEELINKRIERTDDISFRESNQREYLPDKSRLASETLANIYLSQGQKSEAIKVYESLFQRNPEKKEYYLEKIRELKAQ